MPSTTEALDRFAQALSLRFAVLFRLARALKEARDVAGERRDLWGLSGPGGGKNAVPVELHHLVNLILALFATGPADAVETVDDMIGWLKGPRLTGSGKLLPDRDTPYATLGEFLMGLLNTIAHATAEQRRIWDEFAARHSLMADVGGHLAWVAERAAGPAPSFRFHEEIFYSPRVNPFENEGRNELTRIVSVPLTIIGVAADLLAEGMAKRGGLDLTSSGKAQATAQPRNENASAPARAEANTRTTDRLRGNGNRASNSREGIGEISKSQALPMPLGRSPLNDPRSASPYDHQAGVARLCGRADAADGAAAGAS